MSSPAPSLRRAADRVQSWCGSSSSWTGCPAPRSSLCWRACPHAQWIMSAFELSPSPEAERPVMRLRAIAVLGLAAISLNYAVLKRLLAIVETVRGGDPFVAANASRLQAIAWALLALQLLSLVIGAIAKAVSTPAHPVRARCRLFDRRLARRTPHVPAGPRVRARHAHARRPRRDGLTWRSPPSSTTCVHDRRMMLPRVAVGRGTARANLVHPQTGTRARSASRRWKAICQALSCQPGRPFSRSSAGGRPGPRGLTRWASG